MPRCLPVRSAGPETSSTSSSSWKASPIARPKRPSSVGVAAAAERAEPAGGLEQPRGLEVAALQVALARDRRRSTRPRAGAARPARAPTRRRRARAPPRRCRRRASSANARENSRSPVAVAIARPGGGDDGRAAAAQRRGVEHVVVHERRGVHELDRDRGAQHRVVVARLRARRRRTPAAAAGACRRRRSSRRRARPAPAPCERASSRQPRLEALHQLRDVRAAGLDDRGDGLRAGHQPATVPACRAMMPPAVRIQRTSARPGARQHRRRAPAAPGKRLTELGR